MQTQFRTKMSSYLGDEAKMTFTDEQAKKLKVLIVTPCLHILDGVSLTIRKVYYQVLALGGQAKIMTSDAGMPFLEKEKLYKDVIFCNSWSLPYDAADEYVVSVMLNKKLKKQIMEYGPNVFHFTSPDPISFSICEWTRKNRWPLIATWHSNIPDYLDCVGSIQKYVIKPVIQRLFMAIYSYALVTYVPQNALIDKMGKQGYINLRVWGRGVDVKRFSPTKKSFKLRHDLGIKDDQVIILWVSRCVKEKRPEVYIEVMERLHKNHPGKAVGILVGRGERYERMKAVPNIIALGWKGGDELAELYASADILLFPSSVETFGNVTLEGLASGTPVLGDVGCSSHLIENGVNGYTCSTEDVDGKSSNTQFYEAAEKLIFDNELRKKMGKNAREIIEEKWEQNKILDEMIAHYCEAAEWGYSGKVPVIKYTNNQRFTRIVYEMIDKGGRGFVEFFARLAFYWADADKLLFAGMFLLATIVFAGTYFFMG